MALSVVSHLSIRDHYTYLDVTHDLKDMVINTSTTLCPYVRMYLSEFTTCSAEHLIPVLPFRDKHF